MQLALNVAVRATLYYSEQIRCLVEEPPKKEKADSKSATDANKSGWITAPQILARYAIKWIVKVSTSALLCLWLWKLDSVRTGMLFVLFMADLKRDVCQMFSPSWRTKYPR